MLSKKTHLSLLINAMTNENETASIMSAVADDLHGNKDIWSKDWLNHKYRYTNRYEHTNICPSTAINLLD